MAVQTLTLPAGTNLTKHFNLPKCGGWVGSESVSLSTFETDATIHSWLFYYPDKGDTRIRIRRTGGLLSNNFKNWTLGANQRVERGMFGGESLCTINYTSTNDISLCMSTSRSASPALYPPTPAASGEANEITIGGSIIAGKVYWLPIA